MIVALHDIGFQKLWLRYDCFIGPLQIESLPSYAYGPNAYFIGPSSQMAGLGTEVRFTNGGVARLDISTRVELLLKDRELVLWVEEQPDEDLLVWIDDD